MLDRDSNKTKIYHHLSEREVGQFPISIATSLALESLVNIHPELKHRKDPIKEMDVLYVNIFTLYRNIYGSVTRSTSDKILADTEQFMMAMVTEIQYIEQWCKDQKKRVCFYLSTFNVPKSLDKLVRLRDNRTDLQMRYKHRWDRLMDKLLTDTWVKDKVMQYKQNIIPLSEHRGKKSYILTHISADLLSEHLFYHLKLLESHTGKLKGSDQWYTKYYNGNKLNRPLPFNLFLLSVLGDSEIFSPLGVRYRDYILRVAERFKWTTVTTYERIKLDLDLYQGNMKHDPETKEELLNIIKNALHP